MIHQLTASYDRNALSLPDVKTALLKRESQLSSAEKASIASAHAIYVSNRATNPPNTAKPKADHRSSDYTFQHPLQPLAGRLDSLEQNLGSRFNKLEGRLDDITQ